MGKLRSALELTVSCLVYCLVIAVARFGVLFLFFRDLSRVFSIFPLVLLLEGGLGLVVGGTSASFSGTVGKLSEFLLRSEPWDAQRQKDAEIKARAWIVTGVLLILLGFLVSAL